MTNQGKTHVAALFAFVVGSGLLVGPSLGQDSSADKTLVNHLEKQKQEYAEIEARAKVVFVGYFDRMSENVRRASKMAPELKASKLRQIGAEKAAYESRGAMPGSPEMLEALFAYQDALHRARVPVARAYQSLMNQALEEHNDVYLQQIVKEKAAYDNALPGHQFFRTGSNWAGSRYLATSAMRTRMSIGKFDAGAFRGRVWQGDNPEEEFIVEGTLNGNYLNFQTVEMVRGAKRVLLYKGYVLNKRMILRVARVENNGKPSGSQLIQMFNN